MSAARLESTPRAKIVAVRLRRLDSPSLTDVEQACLTFVGEVLHHNRASDVTFERLRRHLSPREIVELLIVVGSYTLVCRVATALALDADRSQGDSFVGFANSGAH